MIMEGQLFTQTRSNKKVGVRKGWAGEQVRRVGL